MTLKPKIRLNLCCFGAGGHIWAGGFEVTGSKWARHGHTLVGITRQDDEFQRASIPACCASGSGAGLKGDYEPN